jgi:hypothetical protein
MLGAAFSCALPCSYELKVVDAVTGEAAASTDGKAVGDATAAVPAADLPPGRYEYELRVYKCGKPGTAEARFSSAFPLGDAASEPSPWLPTLQPVLPGS